MTRYVVLRFRERGHDVESWDVAERVEANSAEQAVRSVGAARGTFVAVPERSWQPLTVETEQKTVTRLAPAQPPAEAAAAAATTDEEA